MTAMQNRRLEKPRLQQAMRAYAASVSHRGLRAQEADLFRRVNAGLRQGHLTGPLGRVRAVADNMRLWTMVLDLVRDPDNRLPDVLRAGIISVGLAVQREMRREAPDFAFLIAVNENIAAGLSGED